MVKDGRWNSLGLLEVDSEAVEGIRDC
jgi:hypothetical protein